MNKNKALTTNHKNINSNTAATAGSDPQPAPVTPEQVVEQLRAIRASLTDLSSVDAAEKKRLSRRRKLSGDVLQAQIDLMAVSDEIPAVLGTPTESVQGLNETLGEWSAVEDEVRIILDTVETHNLVTRHELQSLTSRATNMGVQLARDPQKVSVFGTHLQEIRRLKRLGRRKKVTPQTPSSADSSAGDAQVTKK
jgi:hypothetical protein